MRVAPRLASRTSSGGIVSDQSLIDPTASAWTADEAVTALFSSHYRALVRLATLLLRDAGAAEEVTQDAYVALHGHWRRLRDPDKAVAYLRQCVVNRCRSTLRHRGVVDRYLRRQPLPLSAPSADVGLLAAESNAEIIAAVRALPARQREALVLRYYADLSEAEIAEAMGVSQGAVKSHTARAMAALRRSMGPGRSMDQMEQPS
jgi:RNA polymerase sigma-70 factor (sigma-E family)